MAGWFLTCRTSRLIRASEEVTGHASVMAVRASRPRELTATSALRAARHTWRLLNPEGKFSRNGAAAQRKSKVHASDFRCAAAPLREKSFSKLDRLACG